MRRLPRGIFHRPLVLLCEGESDKRFFDQLISERNISQNFYVQFPSQDESGTGGRSKFGTWLSEMRRISETFNSNVKGILVVSDNDEDPETSFKEVQREIAKAQGLLVPNKDQAIVIGQESPAIAILMIPIAGCGNLETLCLPAVDDKWHLTEALNTFVAASPATQWNLSKQSKMRLQTTLSATCKPKPDTTFAQHWEHKADYRIPLDHTCFDSVAQFLKKFDTLVLGAQPPGLL